MPRGERLMVPEARPTSYYGRPVIKEPAWKWPIPAYLFSGGLAAGSALLGAGSRLAGDEAMAERSSMAAAGAIAISTGLLVADLGRPERFANMLRVAKPTSPMSMGSWLLAGFAPAAGMAAISGRLRVWHRTGLAAQAAAAALAPVVATYTAVLVADTAVPVWRDAGHQLPFVFAGGSAASAGGLGVILSWPDRTSAGARAARRMALAGAALELGADRAMRRRLGPLLSEPYHQGRAAILHRASTALTVAGAGALALVGGGRRPRPALATLSGAAIVVGAAIERFAVFEAGRQSARDPKYTVGPQRARLNAPASNRLG